MMNKNNIFGSIQNTVKGKVFKKILIGFSVFCGLVNYVNAGGVSLGATRVIYPADAKQISLAITNSDKKNRFLIHNWVEDSNEEKTTDFILTPPLFVSKANSENTLRIMYVGNKLANDRETLFWLNSKSIPAVEREEVENKNVLQLAVLSRIKLFVRPANLPSAPDEAPKQLVFSKTTKGIEIKNMSPYFLTLVNIKMGGRKLPNTMVAPKSSTQIITEEKFIENVVFQTINDYGANSPFVTAKFRK